VDLTFDPTAGGERVGLTGGSPIVNCVLEQPDGKVLIGAGSTALNGVCATTSRAWTPTAAWTRVFSPV